MTLTRSFLSALAVSAALILPATAETGFKKIDTKNKFLQVTDGKRMTIVGISVFVTPDGKIGGKAYGRPVSGAWSWRDGFFCRDLYWGERDFGPNCQEVRVNGNKIRFASDRGSGQSAVLTLR